MEGQATIVGQRPNDPAAAPAPSEAAKPRLGEFARTMRITGQEGARFWGTVESPARKEDLVGTLTGEGSQFVAVGGDGFLEGVVDTGGKTMRWCCRQLTPPSRLAGCGTAARE